MKHLEVRQKYSAACRIFNSLLSVSSRDEALRLMLDILHKGQWSLWLQKFKLRLISIAESETNGIVSSQLKESGIPLTIAIQNPRSTDIQRLNSSTLNPGSKNVLDSLA